MKDSLITNAITCSATHATRNMSIASFTGAVNTRMCWLLACFARKWLRYRMGMHSRCDTSRDIATHCTKPVGDGGRDG